MQTMVPLYGFGGVPYSAVRKAAPRNLLDNSDFTNLVAQAGIGGNHGSVVYAADRWKLTSGTVTYTAGTGLKLNGTITQVLEKALTGGSCFVGMASGTATIALNGNTITITSSGGVIKWAVLYTMEFTVATLPEYQPKGYNAELVECLRYYRDREHFNCAKTVNDLFSLSKVLDMRALPSLEFEYFSPYGADTVFDLGGSSIDVSEICYGRVLFGYARLPKCSAHNAGALCVNLIADL